MGSVDTQCPSVGWTRTLFVITTKKRAHAAGLQEQEQEQGRSACIRPRHSKAQVQVPNQICWSSGRRRVGLDDSNNFSLCLVESKGEVHSTPPPVKVKVKLYDCVVNMEVDTSATMSLMSQATFQGLWPGRGLQLSGPQGLHKGTDSCSGMLQCQH